MSESKDNREEGKGEEDLDLGGTGDEDVNIEHFSESKEDFTFEEVVAVLEDAILGEEFQSLQNNFIERHCDIFEESAENKLEYTPLFQQYTKMVEDYIESKIKSAFPDLTMPRVESMLASKKDELSGDVFDVMSSLGDFHEFKELMLSQKRAKNIVNPSGGLGLDLCITGKHV